jgi:3-deoxy-D-manno-octulosonate 8-phosphate phosphatase (KDO 8-P phosphatase)
MFLSKLHTIKAFIFDIDGVMTDATVQITEAGEQLRRFNVKDGYALQLAVKRGFKVFAISGSKSKSGILRLERLGLSAVHIGIENKTDVYHNILNKYHLSSSEIVYMGDDIPDLPVMKTIGVPVCPADAAEEIKSISTYISPKTGGSGCVRDIIEKVLRVQKKWFDEDHLPDSEITSA